MWDNSYLRLELIFVNYLVRFLTLKMLPYKPLIRNALSTRGQCVGDDIIALSSNVCSPDAKRNLRDKDVDLPVKAQNTDFHTTQHFVLKPASTDN